MANEPTNPVRTPEQLLEGKMWQVLLMFVVLYSIDSVTTATVAVLMGVDLDQLSKGEKVIRLCLIAKAWASSMLALVTMVVKRVQAHESPLPINGNGGRPAEEKKP